MKATKSEVAQAVATLRELLPPGSRVHCVLRHVARSGMSRTIDFHKLQDGDARWLTGYIATVLGYTRIDTGGREGIRVGGCGMDMGFHVVSTLSRVLYPQGFGCIGEGCPSNDHSNGDRDYTDHRKAQGEQSVRAKRMHTWAEQPGHWHKAGDYAIESRWL